MKKPIPNFPDYYITSNADVYHGNKKLSPSTKPTGYKQITLYKNKKPFTIELHSLMKKVFNLKGQVVDHKNGNRSNNSLTNLRGQSYSQNNKNKHGSKYKHNRDLYGG